MSLFNSSWLLPFVVRAMKAKHTVLESIDMFLSVMTLQSAESDPAEVLENPELIMPLKSVT